MSTDDDEEYDEGAGSEIDEEVNVMTQQRYRTVTEVHKDGLWPSDGGLGGPDPEQSLRHQAIAEVLCCIPPEDYEVLKEAVDSFVWFIPHYDTHGQVHPFFVTVEGEKLSEDSEVSLTYSKVLYLSPRLEKAAWDITVGTVAHEVAHVVLGHSLFCGPEYEAQEEAVFDRICEWGFERQAKKNRALNKWRKSWNQAMVRKLLAQKEG